MEILLLLSMIFISPPKNIKRLKKQNISKTRKKAQKVVNLINLHTKDIIVLGFPSQKLVSRFFRCRITNQTIIMDNTLIPALKMLGRKFKKEKIHIVSGFRSPRFNEMRRKKLHEVALRSNHIFGKAVDFAIPGIPTAKVVSFLRRQKKWGIGYYPQSKFLHMDNGGYRNWKGQ
jgi:uncharacterized protein YcbK (DUF882 family)